MFQLGILGSSGTLNRSGIIHALSRDTGRQVALRNACLVFGFEGSGGSVSEVAARAAKRAGGMTMAFLWGNTVTKPAFADITVSTGQERGGGREFAMIRSCDAVIGIGGGSGTLMEFCMAYQLDIPIVVLTPSGGWSRRLAEQPLDSRQRLVLHGAENPLQAVTLAMSLSVKKI